MDSMNGRDRDEVFSEKVRAGKRTYFFDVRSTRNGDYYVTITESKRRFDGEGYDKHKVFLYKEDFNKFQEALDSTINHVKTELLPDYDYEEFSEENKAVRQAEYEANNPESFGDNEDKGGDEDEELKTTWDDSDDI